MADAPPAGERGGFGRGFGGRGRGRGGERGRGRGRGRRDEGEEKWVPVTKLGRLVQQVGAEPCKSCFNDHSCRCCFLWVTGC